MEKQWWYSFGSERKGPVTGEELCALIGNGALSSQHLVWKKGFDNWLPISEVSEFSDALCAIPPELPGHTSHERNIELPSAGPWRRFFARLIDLWVIGLPVAYLVSLVGSALSMEFALWMHKPQSQYIFGWLIVPLVLLVEASVYGVFGATPGKALLGIKVDTTSAHKVNFGQYLNRLVGLYWSGLGTGFPLVSLFAMAYQHGRLARGKQAGYDESRFNVRAVEIGVFRIVFAVLLVAGIFFLNSVFQAISQSDERAYYFGSDWTNDVTGRRVSIPGGWVHERQKNESGESIDVFSGPRVGSFAVFAMENVDLSLSLSEYARFWAVAVKETMILELPGRTMQINGRAALKIAGTMANDRTQVIDAVLVREEGRVWRFLLLGGSGSGSGSDDGRKLRDALFLSIER